MREFITAVCFIFIIIFGAYYFDYIDIDISVLLDMTGTADHYFFFGG